MSHFCFPAFLRKKRVSEITRYKTAANVQEQQQLRTFERKIQTVFCATSTFAKRKLISALLEDQWKHDKFIQDQDPHS